MTAFYRDVLAESSGKDEKGLEGVRRQRASSALHNGTLGDRQRPPRTGFWA
jgi:hypothetical protein